MRFFAALVLCSACAEEAAAPQATSTSMRFWLRALPPGECEPAEYTVASRSAHDFHFRVDLTPDGRSAGVRPLEADGSAEMTLAHQIVRESFHCRHPLTAEAPRVIESYPVHFRPVEPPRSRGMCGQGLRRPDSLEMLVAIDENGEVVRAWPINPPNDEFVPHAVEAIYRCRFTPARVGESAVPSVLRTLFTWDAQSDDGKPFDKVYPIQERRPF